MNKIIFPIILLVMTSCISIKKIKVDADSSFIQYEGRIDNSSPKYVVFNYSGVSATIRFKGVALSAIIHDYAEGGEQHTNFFNVIVDDSIVSTLEMDNEDTLYTLAQELSYGEHTVKLFKRTEAQVGKSAFSGFIVHGTEVLTPLPKPERKVEFIGDSWSVGYGNLVSTDQPNTGYHSKNEDNYYAWGAVAARILNAQYHCEAISGRGVYRNNTGLKENLIPVEFKRTLAGDTASKWDFTKYTPDVTVIRLGANDIYPEAWEKDPLPLDSAEFVAAYIQFVKDIRAVYPNTSIFCVYGGSIDNEWPVGKNWLTRFTNNMNAVVGHFNAAGDNKVYLYKMTDLTGPWGEDWHPSVKMHQTLGKEIAAFIKLKMKW